MMEESCNIKKYEEYSYKVGLTILIKSFYVTLRSNVQLKCTLKLPLHNIKKIDILSHICDNYEIPLSDVNHLTIFG